MSQFYKPSFANGINMMILFLILNGLKPKVISNKDLSFKNFKKK